MSADFQTVRVLAQMIGVVDHPAREPQDLALKRRKHLERIRTCRAGFFRRHWAPCPDQCLSLARLVLLAGASSTVLQAGGRAASIIGFAGLPGAAIVGCSTLSVSQRSSSLELQPSSPATGLCALQFGESPGHFRRT